MSIDVRLTTEPAQPAVHVHALEKSYDELHVLRGVDFDVARGSIFALLGSNGAGKTTVVNILSTLLKADAGTVTVAGFEVAGQAATPAGVLAWLAVAGILILLTLALTWLAVIAGLSAKTADGAGAFAFPLIFLPFISSAFVPTDTMPAVVAAFAEHQPVTPIVNTIRDLYAQQPEGTDIWVALAWSVGLLLIAYAFAMAIYRRKFH